MTEYFSYDYHGAPFHLFGPAHLWTTFAIGLVFWLLLRAGRRDPELRPRVRWGIVAVMLGLEAASHWFWAAGGGWTVRSMLPLHMCGIMTWVASIGLAFQVRRIYPLIFFLGIGGAIQAIITPDAGVYGFPHFRFFEAMLSHAALVFAGLWVVIAEDVRPTGRDLAETFVGLNLYALVIYFINLGLGSNYLYVNGKPEVATAMDFMPEWPYYILVLEALALGLFTLMYLPFWWQRTYGPAADRNVSAA